jgi:hypothetical protein
MKYFSIIFIFIVWSQISSAQWQPSESGFCELPTTLTAFSDRIIFFDGQIYYETEEGPVFRFRAEDSYFSALLFPGKEEESLVTIKFLDSTEDGVSALVSIDGYAQTVHCVLD